MNQQSPFTQGHAVVIGGSLAGLVAARVLADHFGQVTIVERDGLPTDATNRKGVPQGRHLHVLLKRGEQVLADLFPGLIEEVEAAGAVRLDMHRDLLWFHDGGYSDRFDGGLTVLGVTRPLLELVVRRRILADPRVVVSERCEVTKLLTTRNAGEVTGVAIRPLDDSGDIWLDADFVVDASGRGSRTPRWLVDMGLEAPPTTEVRIGLHYTSRMYERNQALLPGATAILTQPDPPGKRGGFLFPVEGNRWMVTLSGMLGDRAPADDRGFLEYARSLPARDIFDVVERARPIGDYTTHAFPSTIRHHYEKLARFPDRYLVIGDAISSFNPLFGQGMSVAADEASRLQALLRHGSHEIARGFFSAAAGVIAAPWMIAVGADFRYRDVGGRRPRLSGVSTWYLSRLTRRALYDHEAALAFGDVMHLVRTPTSLFAPRLARRVLAPRRGRPAGATATPASTVPAAQLDSLS